MKNIKVLIAASLLCFVEVSQGAGACVRASGFSGWLNDFKKEAVKKGVSQKTIKAALSGVSYNTKVIANDRQQGVFSQSFLKFSGRMVNSYRLSHGKKNLNRHRGTFNKVRAKYGVQPQVITALWGLETDYGANTGSLSTISALATLASDCRRPKLFRPQLLSALRILDRGDLTLADMRGAWAGEIGQVQFLPSDYISKGVDFDQNGKVDLRKSVPDVLASAANLIRSKGWKSGQPWLEEVKVPASLAWEQADVKIKHPKSTWGRWGVRKINGQSLSGSLPASLLLPMGKDGPAFLAYPNFDVFMKWNNSLVYATTAAYFATRLAGQPKASNGRGAVQVLSTGQAKQVQSILQRKGYNVGKIDGVIGSNTRKSVRAMQKKLGIAADGYPTVGFLRKLK